MRIKYLLALLLIVILSVPALPQDDKEGADSTDNGWDWGDWKDWDHDMDVMHMGFKGSPTVMLRYGISTMNLDKFTGQFADPNLLEVRLGYTNEKDSRWEENIIKYDFKFLFLSNISTDINNVNPSEGELKNNLWRFGGGRASGYGYKIGKGGIIPYYSYDLSWSKLDLKDQVVPNDTDKALLDNFNGSFRFGTNTEAGLKIKLIPMVSLDASYERAIIFPRHLFWKWLGSVAIESVGQFLVDGFVKEIMSSSPYAGPVMSFILKNALSYGIYELRQTKMNWPFSSAAPLAYDQFKFGFIVNF